MTPWSSSRQWSRSTTTRTPWMRTEALSSVFIHACFELHHISFGLAVVCRQKACVKSIVPLHAHETPTPDGLHTMLPPQIYCSAVHRVVFPEHCMMVQQPVTKHTRTCETGPKPDQLERLNHVGRPCIRFALRPTPVLHHANCGCLRLPRVSSSSYC